MVTYIFYGPSLQILITVAFQKYVCWENLMIFCYKLYQTHTIYSDELPLYSGCKKEILDMAARSGQKLLRALYLNSLHTSKFRIRKVLIKISFNLRRQNFKLLRNKLWVWWKTSNKSRPALYYRHSFLQPAKHSFCCATMKSQKLGIRVVFTKSINGHTMNEII